MHNSYSRLSTYEALLDHNLKPSHLVGIYLLEDEDGETRRQFTLELADRNITHQTGTESTLDQDWETLKECTSTAADKVRGNQPRNLRNHGSQTPP